MFKKSARFSKVAYKCTLSESWRVRAYHLSNGLIHMVGNWGNDFQGLCTKCECMKYNNQAINGSFLATNLATPVNSVLALRHNMHPISWYFNTDLHHISTSNSITHEQAATVLQAEKLSTHFHSEICLLNPQGDAWHNLHESQED